MSFCVDSLVRYTITIPHDCIIIYQINYIIILKWLERVELYMDASHFGNILTLAEERNVMESWLWMKLYNVLEN